MTSLDPLTIRDQFPALALEQDGQPVVYLDGPGGTQVPQRVIDAVIGYYRTMNANDGGAFQTSEATMAMVAGARAAVADLLGAADPDQIHFGANTATAIWWSGPSTSGPTTVRSIWSHWLGCSVPGHAWSPSVWHPTPWAPSIQCNGSRRWPTHTARWCSWMRSITYPTGASMSKRWALTCS